MAKHSKRVKSQHPPLLSVIKDTVSKNKRPKTVEEEPSDSDEEVQIGEEEIFEPEKVKVRNSKKKTTSTTKPLAVPQFYEAPENEYTSDFEDEALSLFPEISLDLATLISNSLIQNENKDNGPNDIKKLPRHLLELYAQVGKYMVAYKSGKLPKAFKVLPRLKEWERLLEIMTPLQWSPNAMEYAVKLLSSSLDPRRAEVFYKRYLLTASRMDIHKNKKLNYHYYAALKKAIFKPSAWMKGILFPLVQDGCTLKEAAIIGSILAKISIPMNYAAAALLHICQLPNWHPTTNYFIRIFVNKQYSLPQEVVNSLVTFFISFKNDNRVLPLLWHKSFLAFVQRYKFALDNNQKGLLLDLLQKHMHSTVGLLIKNEIIYIDPMKILNQNNSNF